jgi:tetratricopeptide (TPR) repeat protein
LESTEFFIDHCLDIHTAIGMVCPYPGSKLFDHCLEHGAIHDKLWFYENVDKYIVNMTSMPDNLWVPWIGKFSGVMNQFQYVKTVEAFRLVKEESGDKNPMEREGKSVCIIWAYCPHCEKEAQYRELIDTNQVDDAGEYLVTGCPNCHKRLRVYIQKDRCDDLSSDSTTSHASATFRGRELQPEEIRQFVYQSFTEYHIQHVREKNIELAESLYSRGKAEEAIAFLISSLQGTAPDIKSEYILVEMLLKKNRIPEAIDRLNTVVQAFPEEPSARTYLEKLSSVLGNP